MYKYTHVYNVSLSTVTPFTKIKKARKTNQKMSARSREQKMAGNINWYSEDPATAIYF